MVLARPVAPCEAACLLLNIPLVYMSEDVTYIPLQSPATRTRGISKSHNTLTSSTQEVYSRRPPQLNDILLPDYFKQYEPVKPDNCRQPILDSNGTPLQTLDHMWLQKRKGLVRFSDPHPVYRHQCFFYRLLVHHVPFRYHSSCNPQPQQSCICLSWTLHALNTMLILHCRDEAELLTSSNRSYMQECISRGIIDEELLPEVCSSALCTLILSPPPCNGLFMPR